MRSSRRRARRRARQGFGLSVALAVSTGAGCKQSHDEAWPVFVADVQATTDESPPPRAWTDRAIAAALGNTPLYAPGEGEDALELEVEFWEVAAGGSSHARDLVVDLSIESPDLVRKAGGPEVLEATVLLERSDGRPASLESDLELALARAVSVLDARTRLSMGDRSQVDALLGLEDPEILILALEHVAESSDPRYAPKVLVRIGDPDERVARAAVEALGRVGGPREAEILISRLRLGRTGLAAPAYHALARMGGSEAEAFLTFAAENEDEPERRRAAMMALRSMRSMNGPASSSPAATSYGGPLPADVDAGLEAGQPSSPTLAPDRGGHRSHRR